ncbi:MAG: hypothetical protein HYV27_03710 [Candidatus Hydrogenedentes bacterium]|nr:hypothetical protein [Candidatus Hydrogenedentota bacterium]
MLYLALALMYLSTPPTPHASLPPGTTLLGDLGYAHIGYQSYEGSEKAFPPGWQGVDGPSGVTYQPGEPLLGRDSFMMHSPWRVPVGKTWMAYPMQLPLETPITLHFGIAMRKDAFNPGKSDGVTFSAHVVDDEGDHELMREHHAVTAWKDFQIDLSAWAGKAVELRLQVEPGPEKDCGWDYSHFSAPSIVAGAEEHPAAPLDPFVDSLALEMVKEVDLSRAANAPYRGVVPSRLVDGLNSIDVVDGAFCFTYNGPDCRIVYRYVPETGRLDDFTAQIDDKPAFSPALGGGLSAVLVKDGQEQIVALQGTDSRIGLIHADDPNLLGVRWEYALGDRTIGVDWRFGIVGKTLTVVADCEDPAITALSLGQAGNVVFRKNFAVPYLWGNLTYLPEQRTFVCRYLDWTTSNASNCPQSDANYEATTAGMRNPLHESGYIAVSPHVAEVLPNLPLPPSPYRELLGPRIVLDLWRHHDGTYAGAGENLRDLKDNGIDHLAIINHVWQHFGYDVKLPDHLPANPQFGGDEGMKAFGQAANECGYVWSLHENYVDMYPDAPSYDETALARHGDGRPVEGWYNGGTGVQAFSIKSNRALEYAAKNSPEIHARYGTSAAYLDVHTCVPPWHVLDHDAIQPMAAVAAFKYAQQVRLFQYERETHGGPLFGEGNHHFFWAGHFDGAEAQVAGGEDHAPLLDFDLLKIHPQMVNHGMGYYERWFRRGYDHQWGYDTGTPEQIDKYRAQEIAYGHAGFIGDAQTDNIQWVAKEHHLMHPIQRLGATATPTAILYEVNGRLAPLGAALAAGQRLRQHIRYDSGLKLWVNWDPKPWSVEGRMLPQWGFLALGPDTEVMTVLQDGHFAGYASCPEFLFADARTTFTMPYRHLVRDVAPALERFEYLGGNRIRLAYTWRVNESLDGDYLTFVHFTSPTVNTADGIAFQQDHGLPKATSQWQAGETIMDGPYDITVPDGPITEYTIAIGLHQGGRRLPMKGKLSASNSVLLGKLLVTRENGAVTGARFEPIAPDQVGDYVAPADFDAHMNPPGTLIDFGPIATDGSVKVNRGEGALEVFPYPRDTAFAVTLDLPRIVAGAAAKNARVTALAARTQAPMGEIAFTTEDGRITFNTGHKGAGRYRVTW